MCTKYLLISYLVGVGSVLVLGSVRRVAEGLGAAGEFAHVGLLPGVTPQMCLQVLQTTVRFPTSLKLKQIIIIRFLTSQYELKKTNIEYRYYF